MFYSNALSVRLKLLKIKKETRTIRRHHEKKSARGRCLVSCSGTLFLLDDDVVDKLFGF